MSGPGSTQEHATRFTALRPLLFTVAYEILGSATDADDVLQESWLRWAEVDLDGVRDTRSYLAQVVTRQALNARRAADRRRETYVGPWLPEPLLEHGAGPGDDAVLAESVSMAMLVLLETLRPDERAVFVLREVFGFDHAAIAEAVGRSVPAVRQVAHRAREHVHARRTRPDPARCAATASVVERFTAAAATGDLARLMTTLAPDVVWTADGGGKASAARRPVHGADRTAALVVGLFRQVIALPGVTVEHGVSNGAPAVVVRRDEVVEAVLVIEVVDTLITHFYAVRNPDKLAALARPISRS